MGAQQIGFLVKGPAPTLFREIVKDKFLQAVTVAQRIVDDAKLMLVRFESGVLAWPEGISPYVISSFEDKGEVAFENFAALDAKACVEEFVEFWTSTDERDTCSRLDPDDEWQQLVYAGEQTYGDSPDGNGYAILNRSFDLGICDVFGIR